MIYSTALNFYILDGDLYILISAFPPPLPIPFLRKLMFFDFEGEILICSLSILIFCLKW